MTALLLVLVIGAAHATRGHSWPTRSLLKYHASAAAAPAAASIPIERSFAAPARAPIVATPARARRVLTIADAELPPVRAPDVL